MRLNVIKTMQETYNCILQGLPLLHSSCIENLINNYVTVGVIQFSVFFYWYDISVPRFPSRCQTARFMDWTGEMQGFRLIAVRTNEVWLYLE